MNKQKHNGAAAGWIYSKFKKFLPLVILLSVVNILLAISYVALALSSKQVIDIATKKAEGSLLNTGVLLFAIVIFQVALSAFSSILKTSVSGKMTISLRNELFSRVAATKFKDISAFHSGDIMTRFTSDTDIVVSAAVNLIPETLSIIAKIIAGVGALFFLNSTFAIIILVIGTVIPLIGRMVSSKFKYLHKLSQKTEGDTRSFLQESFQNLVVLKAFASQKSFLKKLNELMRINYKAKVKKNYVSVTANILLYSFFVIGYYAVLIWGAGLIAVGAITYGTLMAFLQLISQLRAPLQNVSGIIPQYYSALASAERLMELESGEQEIENETDEEIIKTAKSFKKISVKDMSFSYNGEGTLKNCNFEIERGGITAIVGKSGCGKTTFFKLLLGLYEPAEGEISFDNGTPITSSTRPLFAYVPQGNLILSGTIRDNITLCN
ncbi:MAG: ABC transporter ATP-binding protein, partial [Elusimicrobia bacterium]|nr:ABC transporter ATP-binding protein [Elusimicrobiota bacterium]